MNENEAKKLPQKQRLVRGDTEEKVMRENKPVLLALSAYQEMIAMLQGLSESNTQEIRQVSHREGTCIAQMNFASPLTDLNGPIRRTEETLEDEAKTRE